MAEEVTLESLKMSMKYELMLIHQEIAGVRDQVKQIKEQQDKRSDIGRGWVILLLSCVAGPVLMLMLVILTRGGT